MTTTTDLTAELIARMRPDNQDAADDYLTDVAGVDDCLDLVDIDDEEDYTLSAADYWRWLGAWYEALDTLHSTIACTTPDRFAQVFLEHEAARFMAKRLDVVEAIARRHSEGLYRDPQFLIDGRGSTGIVFSNGVVDYDDASGKAIRLVRDARRGEA